MLDNVRWLVDGQVICVQFSKTVNRDQIHEMNRICIDLLDTKGQPPAVHVIIDVSLVAHYERNMMNIELLHNNLQPHPLVGWILIIDPYPNAIIRFVGMTLCSLMKFHYHTTKTLDEAIAFITPKLSNSSL